MAWWGWLLLGIMLGWVFLVAYVLWQMHLTKEEYTKVHGRCCDGRIL